MMMLEKVRQDSKLERRKYLSRKFKDLLNCDLFAIALG